MRIVKAPLTPEKAKEKDKTCLDLLGSEHH